MTATLSPAAALAHLAELSPDVREGIVLDAGGTRLAGSAALAGPAAELLDQAGAPEIEVVTDRGAVFVAADGEHAIAVVAARAALPSLMFCDLRAVLGRLGGPR
jgi:hypothetical protein